MKAIILLLSFTIISTALYVPSNGGRKLKMYKNPSLMTSKNSRLALPAGNVSLADYYDTVYLIDVAVGTPPQLIPVELSLRVADIWVFACNDTVKTLCYNKNISSTYQYNQTLASMGTPTMPTVLASDVVSLGDVAVNSQGFAIYVWGDYPYPNVQINGLLGLGWQALANLPTPSLLSNIGSLLTPAVFTISLDKLGSDVHGQEGGQLILGATDTQNCDANINYVKLSSLSYWQFTMNDVYVGSYGGNKAVQAMVDPGTSLIGVPYQDLKNIMNILGAHPGGNNVYYVSCDDAKNLPDIVFNINGINYNIPQEEYIVKQDGKCMVSISSFDFSGFGPTWILGDPFIRTYCVVCDVGNQQIGFSKARHAK